MNAPETWTREDTSYVLARDKTLKDGARFDGWFRARKTALTTMRPLLGPARVVTQEGEYELPAGWEGFIAIDTAGYPYPIAKAEFERTFAPEPVYADPYQRILWLQERVDELRDALRGYVGAHHRELQIGRHHEWELRVTDAVRDAAKTALREEVVEA